MPPVQTVVAGAAVVAVAAGVILFGGGSPEAPPPPPVAVSPAADDRSITVHVSGAVAVPGLVVVPAHGRVADAVAAAGGATPDAALGSVNLAAPVRDGQLVVVPSVDVPAAAAGAGGPTAGVRINMATAGELEQLPGVGPVLAARIVEYRTEHGPFVAPEDLLDVPGIGEAKLASLRDAVVIP